MRIYQNNIPSSHLFTKKANTTDIVPEQDLSTAVNVYTESLPWINCQLASTINHEGAHRKHEEEVLRTDNPMMPSTDAAESRARAAEINCEEPDAQAVMEGGITSILPLELLNNAKLKSSVDYNYIPDVKAGNTDVGTWGMFLFQIPGSDLDDDNERIQQEVTPSESGQENTFYGQDGTLWIDVRSIIQRYIVNPDTGNFPSTYQNDGAPDLPGASRMPVSDSSWQVRDSIEGVEGIKGIEGITGRE